MISCTLSPPPLLPQPCHFACLSRGPFKLRWVRSSRLIVAYHHPSHATDSYLDNIDMDGPDTLCTADQCRSSEAESQADFCDEIQNLLSDSDFNVASNHTVDEILSNWMNATLTTILTVLVFQMTFQALQRNAGHRNITPWKKCFGFVERSTFRNTQLESQP